MDYDRVFAWPKLFILNMEEKYGEENKDDLEKDTSSQSSNEETPVVYHHEHANIPTQTLKSKIQSDNLISKICLESSVVSCT